MLVSVSRRESLLLERALWSRAAELKRRVEAASPGVLESRLAPGLPTVGAKWSSDLERLEVLALRVNDRRVAADRANPWVDAPTDHAAWLA